MEQINHHSPFRRSRDGRQAATKSSTGISYKPPAIRFICLFGFTTLFLTCIGAIEWLVSETSTANLPASATAHAANLDKRILTTITTWNPNDLTCETPPSTLTCTMNSREYRSSSAIAENSFASLCSVYSQTFEPYHKVPLPQSLQMAFTQWSSSLYSQSTLAEKVDASFYPCTYNPVKQCSEGWWYVFNSTSLVRKTFTVGCSMWTTMMNPPCRGRGGVSLLSNGVITTTSIAHCGAKRVSQLLITTDVPISTSITQDASEANKAVAEIVPLTIATSDSVTPSTKISVSLMIASTSATRPQSPGQNRNSTSTSDAKSSEDTDLRTPTSTRPTSKISASPGPYSSVISSEISTITSKPSMQSPYTQNAQSTASHIIPGDATLKLVLDKNELIVQRPFTWLTYFVAVFLPAVIAVIVKSLWEIIATSLKLVEPFQRLTERPGSEAKSSLLTQYLESMISFDIFRALTRGRVIPISSACIYIMVELAPLIASLSMNVKPRKSCLYEDEYRPCDPVWILNMPQVRLLEAFLLIAAILSVCLMYYSRKSRIPVATNPGSIASLASLLNHDPLIRELQKIEPDANDRYFKSALKNKLFRVTEHYDTKTDQTRSGFVLSRNHHQENQDDRKNWFVLSRDEKGATSSYKEINELTNLRQPRQVRRSWSWLDLSSHRWLMVLLQFLTTTALLAILLTYWFDTNTDDSFNRFFNGESVAPIIPKLLFVGLAVVIDVQIKWLDRIIRITDPFRRLAMRNARPETTILLPLNGTCWSNLGRNFYLLCRFESSQGRMSWVTTVSFVACLSDINIIAVTGFLQNVAQTEQSYAVCGYISMICTFAMFLVILVTMIWWLNIAVIRRMPRHPDTIGHILSYLCGSEMVRDWNSVSISARHISYLNCNMRDELIKRDGRRFCFGRMLGTDDKERWCIDYEREQSQVMVINDVESRSIVSVPPLPEHWRQQHQQIKRKPVPIRTEQQDSGWEPTRIVPTGGFEYFIRQPRFPSLRLTGGQDWISSRNREAADCDVLIRH